MRKSITILIALMMTFTLATGLCGCVSLTGDVKILSAHGDGKEINKYQAKQIAVSQVPGSTIDEVSKIREGTEEGFLIYKGKLKHKGVTYSFKLDMASGNIVNWKVKK